MQYKALHKVSEVLTGYAFRGAINDNPLGTLCVAQASNIDVNQLYLDTENLKKIDEQPARARAYLEEGDVIIASRTSMTGGFKASVFAGYERQIIASSSVLIIRPSAEVTSEYLSIYLNSVMGQTELNRDTSGSYIKALLRKQLLTVSIPIPSMTEQDILAKLSKNTSDQNMLLEQKIHIHKNILQGALFNTLNK
jgi:type I restriction enzyme S subunit